MPEPVACKRHPKTPTRLRCSVCEDPICPQCLVQGAVGQKCPADAKQPRSARATGSPKQIAKGVGAGVVIAAAGGFVLGLVLQSTGGFLAWILSYFGGYGMGEGVRKAADGNGGSTIRSIAMVAAGLMIAIMWYSIINTVVPRGLSLITYPAAIYGASQRFPFR